MSKKLLKFTKQSALKIEVFKNDNNKTCAPKLIFFNEKKIERFG